MTFRNPTGYEDESRMIRFMVVSSDAICRTALVEILGRPLDHFVPRAFLGPDIDHPEVNGTVVEVTDPTGCFLNEPQLTGRVGFAAYLQPVAVGDLPCRNGYQNAGEPRWEIMSMAPAAASC